MGDLGHEWTQFYLCAKCGVSSYEAHLFNIVCGAVTDEDEADTPLIVEAKP